jgi:hypothetical protein
VIDVTELAQTCGACPSQWEGRTRDGGHIYVRYRHGQLRIGVGATESDAVKKAMSDAPDVFQDDRDGNGYLEYWQLKDRTAGLVDWP